MKLLEGKKIWAQCELEQIEVERKWINHEEELSRDFHENFYRLPHKNGKTIASL